MRTALIVILLFISYNYCYSQTGYWQELYPPTNPGSRFDHAMCSIGENKVLLFGGMKYGFGEAGDTWIFDYETVTWTEIHPENSPSPRIWSDMVQISKNQVLLYAGMSTVGPLTAGEQNDVWIFDLDSLNWFEIEQKDTIRPRMRHKLAILNDNEVLAFGGHIKGNRPGDSWTKETAIYNIKEKSWRIVYNLPRNMKGREGHMITQVDENQVYMIGGHTPSIYLMNDNWLFDQINWDSLDNIENNIIPIGATDIIHMRDGFVLLYGGNAVGTDPTPETYYEGTWIFDYHHKRWSELDLIVYPHGRYFHRMARVGSNKVLMFGGAFLENLPAPDDTWLFTLDTLSLGATEKLSDEEFSIINLYDEIQIRFNSDYIGNCKLELIDVRGRSVLKQIVQKNEYELNESVDISWLHNGVYIFCLRYGSKMKTTRIIQIR